LPKPINPTRFICFNLLCCILAHAENFGKSVLMDGIWGKERRKGETVKRRSGETGKGSKGLGSPEVRSAISKRRTNSALIKFRRQPLAKASGMDVNGTAKTNHATDFST